MIKTNKLITSPSGTALFQMDSREFNNKFKGLILIPIIISQYFIITFFQLIPDNNLITYQLFILFLYLTLLLFNELIQYLLNYFYKLSFIVHRDSIIIHSNMNHLNNNGNKLLQFILFFKQKLWQIYNKDIKKIQYVEFGLKDKTYKVVLIISLNNHDIIRIPFKGNFDILKYFKERGVTIYDLRDNNIDIGIKLPYHFEKLTYFSYGEKTKILHENEMTEKQISLILIFNIIGFLLFSIAYSYIDSTISHIVLFCLISIFIFITSLMMSYNYQFSATISIDE